MEFTGKMVGLSQDWASGEWRVTFSVNEKESLEAADAIRNFDKLEVKAERWHERRSLDANGLMWMCIQKIAAAVGTDKWKVYLDMLKSYSTCCPVTINAEALNTFKASWREVEEVGRFKEDGIDKVSLLCYFGSSHLNSKEFSRLLDGIIFEMKLLGLQPPASKEMRRVLEAWEKHTAPSEA